MDVIGLVVKMSFSGTLFLNIAYPISVNIKSIDYCSRWRFSIVWKVGSLAKR